MVLSLPPRGMTRKKFENGLRRIVFIVPNSVLLQWSVDHFMQETTGQQLVMQYFDNIDNAKAWIAES